MPTADVDALLEAHLTPMRRRTGANHRQYLRDWRAWLATMPVPLDVLDVDRHHVQGWISAMLDEGMAPATARSKAAAVRALYRDLTLDRVIAADPCTGLRLPRAPRRSDRAWLSREELRALLASSHDADPAIRAAVHLWALSGLRPAEPITARIEHLAHHDDLTVLHLPERKGGDSDRPSLSRETADAVWAAAGERTSGPLLMHPRLPRPLDLPAARGELRVLLAAAGIDKIVTPYGLRASFFTLGLQAGISERDMAASGGHATTAQIPVYDKLWSAIATDRNATHRLTAWVLDGEIAA